jgi:chromosome segregation ATPase
MTRLVSTNAQNLETFNSQVSDLQASNENFLADLKMKDDQIENLKGEIGRLAQERSEQDIHSKVLDKEISEMQATVKKIGEECQTLKERNLFELLGQISPRYKDCIVWHEEVRKMSISDPVFEFFDKKSFFFENFDGIVDELKA